MNDPRYRQIQNELKEQIQQGKYMVGDFLPSENELCHLYRITRTTARKALDELTREGFIKRFQGKGSQVQERRKTLGLLNVKGFSEAVGKNVVTVFLQTPVYSSWNDQLSFKPGQVEADTQCIYFERLRRVGKDPVMHEMNWFSSFFLPGFLQQPFTEGSFFKTLSQQYLIEITGSEQEIRAENASAKTAELLNVDENWPILHISIRFSTSKTGFHIYSELFCRTDQYPVGNSYHL